MQQKAGAAKQRKVFDDFIVGVADDPRFGNVTDVAELVGRILSARFKPASVAHVLRNEPEEIFGGAKLFQSGNQAGQQNAF